MEINMEVPQKLKKRNSILLSYASSATPGYLPERDEVIILRCYIHNRVYNSAIHSADYGSCPDAHQQVNKWAKKTWDIYTAEYNCAMKDDKAELFVGKQMDFKSLILSKINQTQKVMVPPVEEIKTQIT